MAQTLMKLVVVVALVALLGACQRDETREAAPAPAEPAPTEQVAEEAREQAEEAAEDAQETAAETGETVQERAAETYEEAKETVVAGYEKTKEAAKETYEKAKEKTEEAVEKVTEAVREEISDAGPDVVIYEARNGNVTFDHKMHAQAVACNLCHVEMPPRMITLDQASAHDLCIGCHRDEGVGPTTCAGCHVR
ncbi:cytochrome c3 family protein [Geoalkalibacter halelectricus]|uniref:Cytochrome c family protein n=1 Tax=Geoalkalibacter halelectricus TaxID=2847045 RepID=A0ABY5ZI22_9BACT|nr:cytochrome c3 family protein [Geoalkalibacter halelectricus]MDO3378979.1 cytochrome c family protein [Geoalkalibacter halelectricus]UWZ78795.1 cytochrome c family protein [Geoalkalibacter halelectricus]